MNNNCLVTKYKRTVNNDSLKKLGVLDIQVKGTALSNNNYVLPVTSKTLTIRLSDDEVLAGKSFTSGKNVTIVDSRTAIIPSTNYLLNVSNTTADSWTKVEVSNKYDLTKIGTYTNGLNLEDIEYCINLDHIDLQNESNGIGNISSLHNINPSTLKLGYNFYNGSLSSINHMTNLVDLGLSTKITGSLSDYVVAQRAAQRQSCNNFNLEYTSRGTNYFGSKVISSVMPGVNSSTLTWDASKMAITAGTKMIVIGYSAAEITELEGQGFTVTACD